MSKANRDVPRSKMRTPHTYARQFQEELRKDLGMTDAYFCPRCFISYIDGDMEGCCFYTRDEDDPDKFVLNCIYDFDDRAKMKEVIDCWVEGALKALKSKEEDELIEKWKAKFAATPYDS